MASGLILTSQPPENFQSQDFSQRINQQKRNIAAVPPSPAADIWVDNPNVGNFNLGKKAGQAIFEKNTKGIKEEKRLTTTKKDAQAILCLLENKYPALVKVITRIPNTYDAVRDPTEWGNLH